MKLRLSKISNYILRCFSIAQVKSETNHKCSHKCDWIYRNHSKSHIESYEIIDSKDYNQPRIVSTGTKLTQTLGHFNVFQSFPNTSCCSQKFPPNKIEKIGWLDMRGSIRDVFIGWVVGMDWREKVTVQNCGRALVKPKNQPGGAVLAPQCLK